MTNLVAASLLLLCGLLLIAICADRGLPAAIETLAYWLHRLLVWTDRTLTGFMLATVDRMRDRRDKIEAETREMRKSMEGVAG